MTDTDPDFKGFNTDAELPSWMRKPPKSQRTPWKPPQSTPSVQPAPSGTQPAVVHHETVRTVVQEATGSKKATAGIIIIATFVAWGFWFGFGLGLSLIVNPLETQNISGIAIETGEVWTFGRSVFCLVFSVLLTWATWWLAMEITED